MRGSDRPKRVTLDDVASAAGVSRATVSRVVNGSKPVAPEVAQAVRRAIDELGYVPNLMARSLMTRRTDMVAVVAGEADDRIFNDPFFAGIVHGIAEELTAADIRLVLSMLQHRGDTSRVQSFLMAGHMDGVLVISEHASQGMAHQLKAAGIPVVIGGRPAAGSPTMPHVDNDNVGGARQATQHLIDRGCRRIATIAGPVDMTAGEDRLAGFRATLGPRFDPRLVADGDFTLRSGADAMAQLLATDPRVDGVFAASDLMALGALQVLRREGRAVPDDVAVVGFDDIELARSSTPPLTTVRQDPVEQGRVLVRLLLTLIGRADDLPRASRHQLLGSTEVVLPTSLVIRASA